MSLSDQSGKSAVATAILPLATRLSLEIPKPLEWQTFQRNCVVLFQAELQDPHAQEYGRNGQNQHGIDIRGNRNCDPEHQVGIQTRRYDSPLKYDAMLDDCRSAVTHFPKMREVIFATTAPDDSKATDDADRVEQLLRNEGHQVRVVLYGWGQLQRLIATHEKAHAVFYPQMYSTTASQPLSIAAPSSPDAVQSMVEALRQVLPAGLLNAPAEEPTSANQSNEDPALHARIDVFRDMFAKEMLPAPAEKGLQNLLNSPDLDQRPWAKFRIHSNLASIAFFFGRMDEAASRYELAFDIRPEDATAKANLALARTIQGRFAEALALAQDALTTVPRSEHALGYLLQAAARSDWEGDPETLIPDDLLGSLHADLGLAEFYRRRDVPGWQQKSIVIARRHADVDDFTPIYAIAVLSLALESGPIVAGGLGAVSAADLTTAADQMKAWIERMLDAGLGDEHDKRAHLNNTCVLLRLCGRHDEVEKLLLNAPALVASDPLLRRLLATAMVVSNRRTAAIEKLSGDADPENALFRSELIATDDLSGGLDQALSVNTDGLPDRLRSVRAQVIAELALRVGRMEVFQQAVTEIRTLEPGEPLADILELRAEKKQRGLTEEEFQNALLELAQNIPDDASMMGRSLLASELLDADLSSEASSLLEGRVDLARVTPTSILFLQTLATARRDEAFISALQNSAQTLRDHPAILWLTAAHAWNAGDLRTAGETVTRLIENQPQNGRLHIFRLEVLLRQNASSELLSELEQPLEQILDLSLSHSFRLAALLRSFGFTDRAAVFAYKLYLENRGNARAWMTLVNTVLIEGGGKEKSHWEAPVVGPDVAVDLTFDDGERQFFVVEPDQKLRRLDGESWQLDHPLVQAVIGLRSGVRFSDHKGRMGTIANLRHKIVARFHYVLEHYEARFPEQQNLIGIKVAPDQPGGLDEFKATLKDRQDWVRQEQEQYVNGPWPLSLLAIRLHTDIIDVAAGLAAQGIRLKVATGNQQEKEAAIEAIRTNRRKGCVLDLHSFWTAWRLKTLHAVEAVGGRIHVCQGVLDRLRARKERLQASAQDGQKYARFDEGYIVLEETSAEGVQSWIADLDEAIAWLEAHANICPLIVSDDLPCVLREHLSMGRSDIYDALALAMQKDLLLITDDLPTREHGMLFGFQRSCWTQVVLGSALHARKITPTTYVRAVANLLGAGHNYVGVSGPELACALRLDLQDGQPVPGKLFSCLSETIGGKNAEPISHATAVVAFLLLAASDPDTRFNWKAAADDLLRKLLRWRHDDHVQILRAVMAGVQQKGEILNFLLYWARGNFIPLYKLAVFQPRGLDAISMAR